jgi:hypothetical protein
MFRSHWMAPAALVLAMAGLARSQGVPAEATPVHKDRFVSIQEVGRPPIRCKLLKSWYEPDGSKAYQVQAVDNGEMISIFETSTGGVVPPAAGKAKAEASRIVHWGAAIHPPSGTPDAPTDATVLGTPLPVAFIVDSGRPDTNKPYTAKHPPVGGWAPAYAHEPPNKTKLGTTQPPVQMAKQTAPAQPIAPPVAKPAPTPSTTTVVKQAAPAAKTTAEAKPVEPAMPAANSSYATVQTRTTDAAKSPVVSTWTSVPAPAVTKLPEANAKPATPVTKLPEVGPKPVEQTKTVAASDAKTTQPAKATTPEWQQSWSKVTQTKSPLLSSAAPPSPAAPRKVDPLQDPESYSKVSTEERITRKLKEQGSKDVATVAAKPVPPPATPGAPINTVKLKEQGTKDVTTVAAKPVPSPAMPGAPITTVKLKEQGTKDASALAAKPVLPPATAAPVTTVAAPEPKTTKPAPATAIVTPTKPATPAPVKVDAPKVSATAKATVSPPVPPPATISSTIAPAVPPPPVPGPMPRTTTPAPTSAMTTATASSSARTPELAPPPGVPARPAGYVPAYISAATTAAKDNGGNAFSEPQPAPKSNVGRAPSNPPTISRMPGYTAVPGVAYAPEPPPVIAAAPSASVVAAGYPLVAGANGVKGANPSSFDHAPGSQELLMTLRTSLYPSQREWAADRLTACDWHSEPQVVEGLARTARVDPAPLVRAGCLRALARMHATCEPAIAVARELRSDGDPRVRQEAEQTLGVLQAVRPVRAE